jgi:hypothetical protein
MQRLYGKKNDILGDFEIGIITNIFQVANAQLPPSKPDGKIESRWSY